MREKAVRSVFPVAKDKTKRQPHNHKKNGEGMFFSAGQMNQGNDLCSINPRNGRQQSHSILLVQFFAPLSYPNKREECVQHLLWHEDRGRRAIQLMICLTIASHTSSLLSPPVVFSFTTTWRTSTKKGLQMLPLLSLLSFFCVHSHCLGGNGRNEANWIREKRTHPN